MHGEADRYGLPVGAVAARLQSGPARAREEERNGPNFSSARPNKDGFPFSFPFFLFYFQIQAFKLNLNSCFELHIFKYQTYS
jgi:hypothetical protein